MAFTENQEIADFMVILEKNCRYFPYKPLQIVEVLLPFLLNTPTKIFSHSYLHTILNKKCL